MTLSIGVGIGDNQVENSFNLSLTGKIPIKVQRCFVCALVAWACSLIFYYQSNSFQVEMYANFDRKRNWRSKVSHKPFILSPGNQKGKKKGI